MPAYIVFTRMRTRNQAEIDTYAKQAPFFFEDRPLKWHARFGKHEILEGPGVEGVAIIEFPTFEDAKAWYNSPAYQEASKHRHLGGDYSAIIVEGVSHEAVH